jgi:hypothetical protein
MSLRGKLITAGLVVGGLVALSLLFWALAPGAPRPPELGGQQVPDTVYEIPFDRQYDLYCSGYGNEKFTVHRNCQILGFTGRGEENSRGRRGSAFIGFSGLSGSGVSSYAEFFEHWLVLKLPDGRLAYIPPNSVQFIEESSPKGK